MTRGTSILCGTHAIERASHRRYSGSAQRWKNGLVKNGIHAPGVGYLQGAAVPIYVGSMGEAALVIYLNGRCGLSLKLDDILHDGERYDFKIGRMTIEVKTRQDGTDHDKSGVNLVRHTSERGKLEYPKTTALVFCSFCVPRLQVDMLGWVNPVMFADRTPVPGRRGKHLNIEIRDDELRPMLSLVDAVDYHKQGLSWL